MNHNHPSGSVKLGTAIREKILTEQQQEEDEAPEPVEEQPVKLEEHSKQGPAKKYRCASCDAEFKDLELIRTLYKCIKCGSISDEQRCGYRHKKFYTVVHGCPTCRAGELKPLEDQGTSAAIEAKLEIVPPTDQTEFQRLNKIVKKGLSTALAVCAALYEIKTRELYRVGGYNSYEEFVFKEHKLKKSTAHQYFNAGRVKKLLDESPDCRPTNQAQVRPLLNVEKDQDVIDIWAKAVTLGGTGGVTESMVAKAKEQHFHLTPRPVRAQATMNRFTAAARACWDKCDEGDRPLVLGEMLGTCADLYDELDQEELTPDLIALFNRIFEAIQ